MLYLDGTTKRKSMNAQPHQLFECPKCSDLYFTVTSASECCQPRVKSIEGFYCEKCSLAYKTKELANYGVREIVRWLENQVADPFIDAREDGAKKVKLLFDNNQVLVEVTERSAKA